MSNQIKTKIKLCDMPEVIAYIEKELELGNIVEIKREKDAVTCVRIDRAVKVRQPIE